MNLTAVSGPTLRSYRTCDTYCVNSQHLQLAQHDLIRLELHCSVWPHILIIPHLQCTCSLIYCSLLHKGARCRFLEAWEETRGKSSQPQSEECVPGSQQRLPHCSRAPPQLAWQLLRQPPCAAVSRLSGLLARGIACSHSLPHTEIEAPAQHTESFRALALVTKNVEL